PVETPYHYLSKTIEYVREDHQWESSRTYLHPEKRRRPDRGPVEPGSNLSVPPRAPQHCSRPGTGAGRTGSGSRKASSRLSRRRIRRLARAVGTPGSKVAF